MHVTFDNKFLCLPHRLQVKINKVFQQVLAQSHALLIAVRSKAFETGYCCENLHDSTWSQLQADSLPRKLKQTHFN